jgi:hypothetical protein
MRPKVDLMLKAILVALVGFTFGALVNQFARLLGQGGVADGSGTVSAVVGGWWLWCIGLVVLAGSLFAARYLSRQRATFFWLAEAAVMSALLAAGTILGSEWGVEYGQATSPWPLPVALLIDGAASPLNWAFTGLAIASWQQLRSAERARSSGASSEMVASR